MKFLTLQRQGGPKIPVLFAGDISHADVAAIFAADRYATLSAGFVRFGRLGTVETLDRSTSLNLGPAEDDAALIGAFYRVTLGSIGATPEPKGRWDVGIYPAVAPAAPASSCHLCPDCPVRQG